MPRYSDGGVYVIGTTLTTLPLQTVDKQYLDQRFTMILLNRGGNLITVFFTPLLRPTQTFEVPVSSPGIALDNLSYEEFVNGVQAIAETAATELQVKLYSNDISFQTLEQKHLVTSQSLYPRDTFSEGV